MAAAAAATITLPGELRRAWDPASMRSRKRRVCIANVSEGPGNALDSSEKAELQAKLAAAEAEAEALKRELASRRGLKDVDLSKLTPATPEKRVDGTGYRETLLGVGGDGERPSDWGLTEDGLRMPEVTEAKASVTELSEEDGEKIVQRRLLIGGGLAAVTLGLSFFKLPPGFIKPPKPLPYYLFRILQLEQRLKDLEASAAGSDVVLTQLQALAKSADEWKDTLLSAAAWLEGTNAEKAVSLAFSIYGYLVQADSNTYFDAIGQPSETQKLEFLRFSLESIKAARVIVSEFLSLVPRDLVDDAISNRKAVEL